MRGPTFFSLEEELEKVFGTHFDPVLESVSIG